MRIAYINFNPFPQGMASTNRTLSICKMMASYGHQIVVHCLIPDKYVQQNAGKPPRGTIASPQGSIKYVYATLSRRRWKPKPLMFAQIMIAFVTTIVRLLIAQPKYNGIIIHVWEQPIRRMFAFVATITGCIFVNEEDEIPLIYYKTDGDTEKENAVHRKEAKSAQLFDGHILMTHHLDRYYRELIGRDIASIVIPMSVEPERFEGESEQRTETIVYCGNLTGNKDGVPILTEAFGLIAPRYPQLELLILGTSQDGSTEREIEAIAQRMGCADRVKLPGYVARDEMPSYLKRAKMLALARPSSHQSTFGFPTKLGEYLMTGNPVVVTAVGEIPQYITDGESAFLAQPDSAEAFAAKIAEVMDDYARAMQIGARGREVGLENFDYRRQAEKLEGFLAQLLQARKHRA